MKLCSFKNGWFQIFFDFSGILGGGGQKSRFLPFFNFSRHPGKNVRKQTCITILLRSFWAIIKLCRLKNDWFQKIVQKRQKLKISNFWHPLQKKRVGQNKQVMRKYFLPVCKNFFPKISGIFKLILYQISKILNSISEIWNEIKEILKKISEVLEIFRKFWWIFRKFLSKRRKFGRKLQKFRKNWEISGISGKFPGCTATVQPTISWSALKMQMAKKTTS